MADKVRPACATCSVTDRICVTEGGKGPQFCATIHYRTAIEKALREYGKPEIREFARMASIQEGECYADRHTKPYVFHPVKPRVQEVCEFAHRMGYKKLGVAFCGGLHAEARTVSAILKAQGFTPISVMCKCGAVPKETIGVQDEEKIRIGEFEPMCNPIVQATILNEENTDFNIFSVTDSVSIQRGGSLFQHFFCFIEFFAAVDHGEHDANISNGSRPEYRFALIRRLVFHRTTPVD